MKTIEYHPLTLILMRRFAPHLTLGRRPTFLLLGLLFWTGLLPGARAQLQPPQEAGTVVSWGSRVLPSVPPGTKCQAIAAGQSHTVALTTDDGVVVWGGNWSDQATVPEVARNGVVAIAAGLDHTVVLKADGSVIAWGDNEYGQTDVPAGLRRVIAIAAGEYHTVAIVGVAPALRFEQLGESLLLSWPASTADFTLQSASSLASPMGWTDFSGQPTVVDDRLTVTNGFSSDDRFFRLRR